MEASQLVIGVFAFLLITLFISIVGYGMDRTFYLTHRIILRKVYYWLALLITLILFGSGNFPFNSVSQFTAFAFALVLIDLFVFQTPDVKSLMTSELKQEELEEDVVQKSQTVENLTNKLFTVNYLMNLLQGDWKLTDFDYSFEKYTRNLEKFLEKFCIESGMNLYLYEIEKDEHKDEFRENIKFAYREMVAEMKFSVRDVGIREDKAVQTLEEGGSIEVIEKNGMHVLLPYYSHLNLLVVVSTRPKLQQETGEGESEKLTASKEVTINGADASILLMLMNAFDLWLLSKPPHTKAIRIKDGKVSKLVEKVGGSRIMKVEKTGNGDRKVTISKMIIVRSSKDHMTASHADLSYNLALLSARLHLKDNEELFKNPNRRPTRINADRSLSRMKARDRELVKREY